MSTVDEFGRRIEAELSRAKPTMSVAAAQEFMAQFEERLGRFDRQAQHLLDVVIRPRVEKLTTFYPNGSPGRHNLSAHQESDEFTGVIRAKHKQSPACSQIRVTETCVPSIWIAALLRFFDESLLVQELNLKFDRNWLLRLCRRGTPFVLPKVANDAP